MKLFLLVIWKIFGIVLIAFLIMKVLAWTSSGRKKRVFHAIAAGVLWMGIPLSVLRALLILNGGA